MLCMQRVSAVSSEKFRQESDQPTDEECEAILSSVLTMPKIELIKINPDDVNLNHPTSYIKYLLHEFRQHRDPTKFYAKYSFECKHSSKVFLLPQTQSSWLLLKIFDTLVKLETATSSTHNSKKNTERELSKL